VELLLTAIYMTQCPWVNLSDGIRYLEMARVSIVTLAYTVYLGVIYVVCQGWGITFFNMSRQQATYLTLIIGTVYLTYSAYFLSVDFEGVKYFMNVRDSTAHRPRSSWPCSTG